MSTTTIDGIRSAIIEHLEQLNSSEYPEDLLNELAESEVPIFYGEILDEWASLPAEYRDTWTQYGMDEYFLEGGIFTLMTVDLRAYYEAQFAHVYAQLTPEGDN